MGGDLTALISNYDTAVLLVYDLFHAEIMIYALLVLSAVLPFLVKIVVIYFLITSFALVFLTDQLYARWFTRVVLSLIVINIVTGGTITSIFVQDVPLAGLRSTRIDSIIMLKSPGDGATSADVDAFGAAPFETYAYIGSDLPVAFDVGSNLAAAGGAAVELNTYKMTVYQLPYSVAATRDDLTFVSAWTSLNKRLEHFPVLGSGLLYISNSLVSLAYSASSLQEVNSIAKTVGQNGNLFNSYTPDIDTSTEYGLLVADVERQLNVDWKKHTPAFYAAASSYNSADADIYIHSLRTSPYGMRQVAGYINTRALDSSYVMDSRIANPARVLSMAEKIYSGGRSSTNDALKYRSEFQTNAAARGYTSKIPPEIYVQSQLQKFYAECTSPSNSSSAAVDYGNTPVTTMFHPCNIVVAGNQQNPFTSSGSGSGGGNGNIAGAIIGLADDLFGFNSISSQVLGFSVADLFGDSFQSFGSGFNSTNEISCNPNLYTLEDLDNEYNTWMTTYASSPQVRMKKECLETAHNMIRVLRQTRSEISNANRRYETFVHSGNASAFQMHAAYAMDLGVYLARLDRELTDTDSLYFAARNPLPAEAHEFFASLLPDPTAQAQFQAQQAYAAAMTDSNLASFAANLRSLLLPFRDGYSVPATVTARTPTAVSSEAQARSDAAGTDENSPLSSVAAAAGATAAVGATAAAASSSWWSRAYNGVKNVSSKLLSNATEKISGFVGKGFSILRKAFGSILRIIQFAVSSLPILMVLGTYLMMYFMTIFSASLGMIFHTLWAIFLTGRLFNGPGSGDEQYGGVSLFPVVQFLMVPVVIGSELCAVGAGGGVAMDFFNTMISSVGSMIGAVGLIVGTGVLNDLTSIVGATAIQIGDPLGYLTGVLKPLGLLVGLTMLPMFVQRLMGYQPYQAAMSPASSILQGSVSSLGNGTPHLKPASPSASTSSSSSSSGTSTGGSVSSSSGKTATESFDSKLAQHEAKK